MTTVSTQPASRAIRPPDDSSRPMERPPAAPLADARPTPRRRDAAGNTPRGMFYYDHPLPHPDELKRAYGEALALLRRWLPLRAALLDDQIGRVEASLLRYRELRREVDAAERIEARAAQEANARAEAETRDLRQERADCERLHDGRVAEQADALARAREQVALARVQAGLPVGDLAAPEDEEDEAGGGAADRRTEVAAETPRAERRPLLRTLWPWRRTPEPPSAVAADAPVAVPTQAAAGPALAADHPGEGNAATAAVRVAFPGDEAAEQARPLAAIALADGLLPGSPAAEALRHMLPWTLHLPRVLSLWACGALFGISMGILVNMLDVQMLSLRFERAAPVLGAAVALGVAIFWSLGRVVSALSALASEQMHASMLARHGGSRAEVGAWHRGVGLATIGVALVVLPLLVAIEAVVERYGIVRVFIDGMANQSIATGQTAELLNTRPGDLGIVCLVLVVSVPFVLLHAVTGWMDAREHSLAAYLKARREEEVWRVARTLQTERLEEARAARARLVARHEEAARRAAEAATPLAPIVPVTPAESPLGASSGSSGVPLPRWETATAVPQSEAGPPPEMYALDARTVDMGRAPTTAAAQDLDLLARVAVFRERAREAYARRREARARRMDALAEYDRRIAEKEEEDASTQDEGESGGATRAPDRRPCACGG